MQSSNNVPATASPQPETILKWLQQEMGYQNATSVDSLRKICRGNMIPVWSFLLERVKSEKTNEAIRRNFVIHGTTIPSPSPKPDQSVEVSSVKEQAPPKTPKSRDGTPGKTQSQSQRVGARGRVAASSRNVSKSSEVVPEREKEKEKEGVQSQSEGVEDSREAAMRDRDAAMGEVGRLRVTIERLVKEIKSRMADVSKEEGERQRGLDDRANSRSANRILCVCVCVFVLIAL